MSCAYTTANESRECLHRAVWSHQEAAVALGTSPHKGNQSWVYARAWLRAQQPMGKRRRPQPGG